LDWVGLDWIWLQAGDLQELSAVGVVQRARRLWLMSGGRRFVWRVRGPGDGGLLLRGRFVDGMRACVCFVCGCVAVPWMTLWPAGMLGCMGGEGVGAEWLECGWAGLGGWMTG
jgi:hypothetical protein